MTGLQVIRLRGPADRDAARAQIGVARRHSLVLIVRPVVIGVLLAAALLIGLAALGLARWTTNEPADQVNRCGRHSVTRTCWTGRALETVGRSLSPRGLRHCIGDALLHRTKTLRRMGPSKGGAPSPEIRTAPCRQGANIPRRSKMKQKAKSAQLVTKSEYARLRGIDPALITRRIASGLISVEGPEELIDVAKTDAALKDALGAAGKKPARRGSKGARPGSGRQPEGRLEDGGLTLHEARTMRAREDATRARIAREREDLALAKLKGEYVAVADVSEVMTRDYGYVRTKLLALPSKLALRLAAETTAPGCFAILTAGVREALEDLVAEAAVEEATARAREAAADLPDLDDGDDDV